LRGDGGGPITVDVVGSAPRVAGLDCIFGKPGLRSFAVCDGEDDGLCWIRLKSGASVLEDLKGNRILSFMLARI
jgi:hypothetical protein